jgi:hypothetical protein
LKIILLACNSWGRGRGGVNPSRWPVGCTIREITSAAWSERKFIWTRMSGYCSVIFPALRGFSRPVGLEARGYVHLRQSLLYHRPGSRNGLYYVDFRLSRFELSVFVHGFHKWDGFFTGRDLVALVVIGKNQVLSRDDKNAGVGAILQGCIIHQWASQIVIHRSTAEIF